MSGYRVAVSTNLIYLTIINILEQYYAQVTHKFWKKPTHEEMYFTSCNTTTQLNGHKAYSERVQYCSGASSSDIVSSRDVPALTRTKKTLWHCIEFYYKLKMYKLYRLINIDHKEVLEILEMGLITWLGKKKKITQYEPENIHL